MARLTMSTGKPQRYYDHPWRGSIGCLAVAIAMVGVGTLAALLHEESGGSRSGAVAIGAVAGFLVIWWPCYVYAQIRMAVWRRTRGFPIPDGEWVEITGGPMQGRRGKVRFRGQAPTTYVVAVDNSDDLADWLTISHLEVRRIADGGGKPA